MARLYNLARMSTATTGTGTITLGSAVAGFLSFASAGVGNGETVTYAIQDGSNSEIGRGVYTASGTSLTRASILKSTNSGAAINLSGTAQVFITAAAEDILEILDEDDFASDSATKVPSQQSTKAYIAAVTRETLNANRTYYVRADGSDSNTGLANTSGGAFLTIQKAVDVVASLDIAIYSVTIQVADGTYTGAVNLKQPVGAGACTLQGNTSTPANCIISTTSATCVTGSGAGVRWTVTGFKLQTTTTGYGVLVTSWANVTLGVIDFGAMASNYSHVLAANNAAVQFGSNYSISGSSAAHWNATTGGAISAALITVTITGTPAFSSGFAVAAWMGGITAYSNTFSGSATGVRYSVTENSYIITLGGGASYLPGDSAGSTATGGIYA